MRFVQLCWWAFRYALTALRHKWFVMFAFERAGVPNWFWRGLWHDTSKFSCREIFGYGFAFHGPLAKIPAHLRNGRIVIEEDRAGNFAVYAQNPDDPEDDAEINAFSSQESADKYRTFIRDWRERWRRTWLRHQSRNPHHWEYWVARSDVFCDAQIVPVPMPDKFIREMIGDWLAAGRAYEGKYNLDKWLSKNHSRIVIAQETMDGLYAVLQGMYGEPWVRNVFGRNDDDDEEEKDEVPWNDAFAEHRSIFHDSPLTWLEEHFNVELGRAKITSDADEDRVFASRTILLNDRDALLDLSGEAPTILVRIKDAGRKKVKIFYLLPPEERKPETVVEEEPLQEDEPVKEKLPLRERVIEGAKKVVIAPFTRVLRLIKPPKDEEEPEVQPVMDLSSDSAGTVADTMPEETSDEEPADPSTETFAENEPVDDVVEPEVPDEDETEREENDDEPEQPEADGGESVEQEDAARTPPTRPPAIGDPGGTGRTSDVPEE